MNTNTQPKVFEWTDELVKEFIMKECNKHETWDSEGLNEYLDEFIKSKQQPIEERIKIYDFHSSSESSKEIWYNFVTRGRIHPDKYDAIKLAIEQVLNNEGAGMDFWKSVSPLPENKKQDTKEDNPVVKSFPTFEEYLKENPMPQYFNGNIRLWELELDSRYQNTYWHELRNKPKAPKEEQSPVEKPPLGIMPEWLWIEQRIKDIDDAIKRYIDAGKFVSIKWITERYELQRKLANTKINIQ